MWRIEGCPSNVGVYPLTFILTPLITQMWIKTVIHAKEDGF
jgi:hypothetical protein